MFDSGNFSKINKSNTSSKLNDSPLTNAKHANKTQTGLGDSSSNTSNSLDSANVKSASNSTSEMRVKVNVEEHTVASSVLYKYISITDKSRTKDVKRAILDKFFLNPDAYEKYMLVQIFTDSKVSGELPINDNCNVFYAARNVENMQFLLRQKVGLGTSTQPQVGSVNGLSSFNSQYNIQNGNVNSVGSPLVKTKLRSSFKSNSQFAMGRHGSCDNGVKNGVYFDDLPPQSPNRYNNNSNHQSKHKNGNNEQQANASANSSSSTWQLFKKKIMS